MLSARREDSQPFLPGAELPDDGVARRRGAGATGPRAGYCGEPESPRHEAERPAGRHSRHPAADCARRIEALLFPIPVPARSGPSRLHVERFRTRARSRGDRQRGSPDHRGPPGLSLRYFPEPVRFSRDDVSLRSNLRPRRLPGGRSCVRPLDHDERIRALHRYRYRGDRLRHPQGGASFRGPQAGTRRREPREDRSRLRRLRWWIGGLLFAVTIINYIDRQTLSVLAPILQREYRWSNSDFATILIAFRLAYTVAQAVFGRVLDWVGTR